ncbi:MAG: class I SAM-dependent methyltransferase [Gammaproteobacteria bacterium]|nr:class I SAM-dependent methyltransferase [Gammaproteobacteria bacterium]
MRRGKLWRRLCRFSFSRRRISRASLARLCGEQASEAYALVVHSNDVNHKRFFPNAYVVSKREDKPANLYTDAYFQDLSFIGDQSFEIVLCTGLLEHVPDPQRIIDEFRRILKPHGRLIISASAVFPTHSAPDNFFHFTAHGFRLLFREWARFEVLRGSSRPFQTIAILLQRINLQCDVFPLFRPVIELLYHVVPWMDVFMIRQYDSVSGRGPQRITDAFMPATLHAVVIK